MSERVVVSDGLSSKYWLTLAGYLTIGVLLIAFIGYGVYTASQTDSQAMSASIGFSGAIFLFGHSAGGLLIYSALFKDASYLRGGKERWNPDWWKYILAGVGVPVGIVVIGQLLSLGDMGSVAAVLSHSVSASAVCAIYLYRRHTFVGVP